MSFVRSIRDPWGWRYIFHHEKGHWQCHNCERANSDHGHFECTEDEMADHIQEHIDKDGWDDVTVDEFRAECRMNDEELGTHGTDGGARNCKDDPTDDSAGGG